MADKTNRQQSMAALILIDVINRFEFPDGDRILAEAMPIVPKLARMKERARRAGIPVIYVNDNFGQWRSDATKLIAHCLQADAPGRKFVEQVRPDEDDYFVLKPMHSAFYQTPLEVLLRYLEVSSLILCGLATNSCITCTAHDANMRDFSIFVPTDCSAARTRREHTQAIELIGAMSKAKVMPSASLRLAALVKNGRSRR